jgi:hypothetical protein
VYSTCIFCHSGLGSNEAIEHFPVGRRLAFDAAKGRLWVVCRECERWNLSPLEERWEAIEECERLFRDTRLRVSTDNIGLARLKEGTTLVRVGDPQRPEMAAWRYGDQFHRRRRKHLVMFTGGAAVVGGAVLAGPGLGMVGFGAIGTYQVLSTARVLFARRTVARVPANGTVLRLSAEMLKWVILAPTHEGGFKLELDFPRGWGTLRRRRGFVLFDDEAMRAARYILPNINRAGAGSAQVAEAVSLLEAARGPEHLFKAAAKGKRVRIAALPLEARLAMEMSVHEADERRALEGELVELEDRWREAEEVAAISDDMFLPASVDAILKKLKRS